LRTGHKRFRGATKRFVRRRDHIAADEYEAEIARLKALILALAEKLFLAAEVLANRAERRQKRQIE
jgi:hypothetical protein